jgi:hypothetical protein
VWRGASSRWTSRVGVARTTKREIPLRQARELGAAPSSRRCVRASRTTRPRSRTTACSSSTSASVQGGEGRALDVLPRSPLSFYASVSTTTSTATIE